MAGVVGTAGVAGLGVHARLLRRMRWSKSGLESRWAVNRRVLDEGSAS